MLATSLSFEVSGLIGEKSRAGECAVRGSVASREDDAGVMGP